nr:MAG TPA: hypothetical protein [Caudoviricetes sp.]
MSNCSLKPVAIRDSTVFIHKTLFNSLFQFLRFKFGCCLLPMIHNP